MSNFEIKIKGLSDRYSNIESINLYSATEVLQSKIRGRSIKESLKQAAIACYTNKKDTTITNNQNVLTDLVYLEMRDAEYFKGYVLEIVSNDKLSKLLIKEETNNFIWRLLISLLVIILGLLYITKKIAKPINVLATKVSIMAHSSTIKNIDVKGSSETRILSENFNFLGEKIRESQQNLEQKVNDKTKELQTKNKELSKLLTERNTLIKEIHHRVKNNLQIIASLLRLQSRTVASDDAKKAFENSVGRVQAMALLHEKLYKNSNFISVKSNTYLLDLIDLFRKSTPSTIKIILKDSDILLGSSQAISIGLILNEFIANSIKHGYSQGQSGEIIIMLSEKGSKLNLVVQNDGELLPDNFNSDNQDTLGMTIIDAFTDKLDGTFKFHNTQNGVELKVVFDKKTIFEEE